jgi:hypothetical protein
MKTAKVSKAVESNAAVAYKAASAEVGALLLLLQAKLEKHHGDFVASGEKNWGSVGDLRHYASVLSEIVAVQS